MNIVLDTDVLIDLEARNKNVLDHINELTKYTITPPIITFITYFEFIFGLIKKSPVKKQKSLEFIENFEVLQTTKSTAKILAELKHKYYKIGKPLPLADLLIASQTIENSMTLVTRNKHIKQVEKLDIALIG